VLATLAVLAVIVFFGSGLGNPLLRRVIMRRIATITGGQVELRTISIRWLALHGTLRGLVIHGKEPAGTPPLFTAEEIDAGFRIDSFWGRKISLNELLVKEPELHVRVAADGTTNIPVPKKTMLSTAPLEDLLLDLRLRQVQIENGWLLYNDVKLPLGIEGGDMHFALQVGGTKEHPLYAGNLEWETIRFTAMSFQPIPANLTAKFTLSREGFRLEQGVLSAARSHMDVQAEMIGFTQPEWSFRYRGWVELLDLKEILRNTLIPIGRADVRGEGKLVKGQYTGTGSYVGSNIDLPYDDYHPTGLSSRGSYTIDNDGLVVPDFFAAAAGGTVKGRVTLRFAGMKFRAETRVEDVHLASLLPNIEHRDFPIDELHWDAKLSATTIETWTAAFEHFEIAAKMHWDDPDDLAAGHQPVTGDWDFRYIYDPNLLSVASGEFETPSIHGTITGVLAARDSALELKFETATLEMQKDFINAIRGVRRNSPEDAKALYGDVRWDGRIVGPAGKAVFQGHLRGEHVRYDVFAFDYLDTDLTYSGGQLQLTHGRARQGAMDAELEVNLALTDWSFLGNNEWSADVNLEKAPSESIQKLFGWSYPVRGLLTGQFHGRGTKDAPAMTGLFDLADGNIYGFSFNRLRGQLNVVPEEVRISDAELRLFAPGTENGRGAGIVTGSAGYRYEDGSISAELVGASLPLASFGELQSKRLPVAGQVSFRLKLSGAAKAPMADGTFRVVDLKIGQDVIGSFDGGVTADGRTAKLQLGSAMASGEISGGATVGLADPYPLDGKISIKNISLDPFLITALHLQEFNGHGRADGDIGVKGELKHPETMAVDANLSKLVLTYANVQLENAGAVHLRSTQELLEIDPATLHGADTNIQIAGAVRFAGKRTVALRLNGAVDLRLLGGFVPDLDARGPAQINTTVEGSMDRPRITGRIHIENAYARMADFPTGLSAIKGDVVFDATRLFFQEVTAEAGGGTLHLSGSVNYAEQPLRYDISLRTDRARIRYPEGMSWLVGGTLRLAGTTTGGVLSGRVAVERVTLIQGIETASVLVSSREDISGPTTTSPFLRNLQFDIEGASTPDARMEWPGAELQAEANLRVRGTWEHPILLGHIHILSGNLYFAGNRYQVARGDLNFANPFRLDPVINVEATTTIEQYEITLNFNGPSSKLALAYRSDPPLPANDIITLLALGQTSAEGTVRGGATTQSSTSGATALLSEAISSQLGGRLQRLFGITRFRVDPGLTGVGASGSEQNAAARITVEQQIARNLTITYVSNVSSTQEQVIQVEYLVNRSVSIVGLRDQNGTFGVVIKIKKRF
jgi:translocation and assembly module TamB